MCSKDLELTLSEKFPKRLPAVGASKEVLLKSISELLSRDPVLEPVLQKKYKAAFRRITEEDKRDFKSSKVIVPISVGQKYHEGGEFEAIIKLINNSFKECIILVGDTLQRHSPEIFTQARDEEEAKLMARQRGDNWLDNNFRYINTLSLPYKIIRWDEWLAHSEFDRYYDEVRKLYERDENYKNTVQEVVNAFLMRGERNSNKEWFIPCASYFLEESAGVCLWIKEGFKYNVYPTGDNKAIASTCDLLMKPGGYEYRSLALNLRRLSRQ